MDCLNEKNLKIIYDLRKHAKKDEDDTLCLKIDKYGVFILVWYPRYGTKKFAGIDQSSFNRNLFVTYDKPVLQIKGHPKPYNFNEELLPIREYYHTFIKSILDSRNMEPSFCWCHSEVPHAFRHLFNDEIKPMNDHVKYIDSIWKFFESQFTDVNVYCDDMYLSLSSGYDGMEMRWISKDECHCDDKRTYLIGDYRYEHPVPAFIAELYVKYINECTIESIVIDDKHTFEEEDKKKLLFALQHLYDVDTTTKACKH
tara:strand:- start:503 stop:1270 length:768 start_codon:yes stop_codon:yes gene_type:complete